MRSSSLLRLRCAATPKLPYSTNVPSSIRSATFSLAVRWPFAWRFATASLLDSSRNSSCRERNCSRSVRFPEAETAATATFVEALSEKHSASTSPSPTDCPTVTKRAEIRHEVSVSTGCSIFMDSMTTISVPAATTSPTRTFTATTVPTSGERNDEVVMRKL